MDKVTGLRLSKETIEQLDTLCRLTGSSKVQVVADLIDKAVNSLNTLSAANVNRSVCYPVGQKLPLTWEAKEHLKEKMAVHIWLVYPEDRVVAVKGKSANGSKSYLEVAATYPEQVWLDAQKSAYWQSAPVTALERANRQLELQASKDSHPRVKEALARGWQPNGYYYHNSLEDAVAYAEEYLADMAQDVAVTEVVLPEPEAAPTPEKLELKRDEFIRYYGLDKKAYAQAAHAASSKHGSYTAPDGRKWKRRGSGHNATWTLQPTFFELAESLGISVHK